VPRHYTEHGLTAKKAASPPYPREGRNEAVSSVCRHRRFDYLERLCRGWLEMASFVKGGRSGCAAYLTERGDPGDVLAESLPPYRGIKRRTQTYSDQRRLESVIGGHLISPESRHSRSKLLNLTGFFSSTAGLLIGTVAAMLQEIPFDQP
jgi:hypothetical protein